MAVGVDGWFAAAGSERLAARTQMLILERPNRMLILEPQQTTSHSVFLSQTLQACARSASRLATVRSTAWTAPATRFGYAHAYRYLLTPGRGAARRAYAAVWPNIGCWLLTYRLQRAPAVRRADPAEHLAWRHSRSPGPTHPCRPQQHQLAVASLSTLTRVPSGMLSPWSLTFLPSFPSATLQAELLTRKGSAITENSSLAIFRVLRSDATFTIAPACVDADSTCDAWHQSGECTRNRDFMARECARSCGHCVGGAATPQPTAECFDANADCPGWVAAGECEANLGFMRENCRLSCRICPGRAAEEGAAGGGDGGTPPLCADETRDCVIWMKAGECHSNSDFMMESCPRSCGFCDGAAARAEASASAGRAEASASAGRAEARASAGRAEASASADRAGTTCVDARAECAAWAAGRQCAKNGDWMRLHCQRACGLCEPPCEDLAEECPQWAVDGWCERNWGHMQKTCRSACGVCGSAPAPECHDMQATCEDWAKQGECSINTVFMNTECRRACGLCVAASGRGGGDKRPPDPPAGVGERSARQESQRNSPASVEAAQPGGARGRFVRMRLAIVPRLCRPRTRRARRR
jgi:hypothetical protein